MIRAALIAACALGCITFTSANVPINFNPDNGTAPGEKGVLAKGEAALGVFAGWCVPLRRLLNVCVSRQHL